MTGASTSARARRPWRLRVCVVAKARMTNTVPSTRVAMLAPSVTAENGGLSMTTRSKRSQS
jgi:hypothetical protein